MTPVSHLPVCDLCASDFADDSEGSTDPMALLGVEFSPPFEIDLPAPQGRDFNRELLMAALLEAAKKLETLLYWDGNDLRVGRSAYHNTGFLKALEKIEAYDREFEVAA